MATTAAIWDSLSQRFELFFHLQVTPMRPVKFRVNWPFSSEEEGKNRFSRWRHLGFPIGTIFAIFISTSHPNPSYQFSNQLALWFRKISEKKSFKMAAMMAILDFDPNNLSYFRSTSHPNASYQVSNQMAFQFRRSEK